MKSQQVVTQLLLYLEMLGNNSFQTLKRSRLAQHIKQSNGDACVQGFRAVPLLTCLMLGKPLLLSTLACPSMR